MTTYQYPTEKNAEKKKPKKPSEEKPIFNVVAVSGYCSAAFCLHPPEWRVKAPTFMGTYCEEHKPDVTGAIYSKL